MFDFQGRIAVVTGAAGALGQVVADELLQAGARVAVLDREQGRLAERFPENESTLPVAADLTDPASVKTAVGRIRERFGGIHLLANVAGGFGMGPHVQDTEDAAWDRMMSLNARSVFHMCREVIPVMLEGGFGRVVNVSARVALEPKGRMSPYVASKAAVLALTQSIAAENKQTPVNVNCILPGTVDTPQNRADMPDSDFSKWVTTAALSDVILFLMSEAARSVNGAAVPVYGES
jgi:NAD(P)-dependent dehydrogenase (short-subunit alcohol dehydrogenase family)